LNKNNNIYKKNRKMAVMMAVAEEEAA